MKQGMFIGIPLALALLGKTVFTWGMLRFGLPDDISARDTLLLFGAAQCLHSLVLLVGYEQRIACGRSASFTYA
jgi:hypothetical protein